MKKLISAFLLLSIVLTFSACSVFNRENTDDGKNDDAVIRIAYMSGPTGMGIAKLMHDNAAADGNKKYEFTKYTDASLATADLLAGKLDMACIPTNTAATIYNKKGENISVLAINCLNSLYVMTKTGAEVKNLHDLEGKTIYTINNGTPAVILRHLLDESGVNATVKTKIGEGANEKVIAAPTDLAPLLISGQIDVALVPEPVATAVPLKIASLNKDYTYTVAINLTEAWAEISDSPVAMGCIVANNSFISAHKSLVNSFLNEYKESIDFISNPENIDLSAEYIVEASVLDATPAAKKSLNNLADAIAYKDGDEMKTILTSFYNAIGHNLIGGKLPGDNFYYKQ